MAYYGRPGLCCLSGILLSQCARLVNWHGALPSLVKIIGCDDGLRQNGVAPLLAQLMKTLHHLSYAEPSLNQRWSRLAIAAFILGIFSGPIAFVLSMVFVVIAQNLGAGLVGTFSVLGALTVPQLIAIWCGVLGLRSTMSAGGARGKALAVLGIGAGVLSLIGMCVWAGYGIHVRYVH
jgi:hypothetical protein